MSPRSSPRALRTRLSQLALRVAHPCAARHPRRPSHARLLSPPSTDTPPVLPPVLGVAEDDWVVVHSAAQVDAAEHAALAQALAREFEGGAGGPVASPTCGCAGGWAITLGHDGQVQRPGEGRKPSNSHVVPGQLGLADFRVSVLVLDGGGGAEAGEEAGRRSGEWLEFPGVPARAPLLA